MSLIIQFIPLVASGYLLILAAMVNASKFHNILIFRLLPATIGVFGIWISAIQFAAEARP